MTDREDKNGRSGIQVISRAAAILRVLKSSKSGMSLGQIAEKVDLPRSTVQRITGALAAERFLISDPEGRGLRLGPELSSLAGAARYNIVEHCRILLTELTQRTGETADLAVMRGAGMVFLDQVPGTHRLTTVSKVGEVFPLTNSANGRACLAELPEDVARKLIQAEWDRRGIDTDPDELMAKLARVRETGLAYDLDEHTPGISGIGFAFRDWGGELHAISVPVPSTRLAETRKRTEEALLKTRHEIEKSFSRETPQG
ncbi:IclR family transcriptional regulator [Tropicimonas sediminicola]|uniref:Transcriptional regulator, IclR family n=1 Tax=Tropicimonas sediminicola TaxID=1031541 RepID=A0A239FCX6_9RHOB|nr:IclR family transcriptional regulator [Tropicimonas sediminicola]SNS54012.1 transcriptional regulator, IclR family [Tropicimonas sediminicola]